MKARGLVSDTSRSGVDVRELATRADISYEMARRYAEGNALPRPDVLQRIAEWLDTSAGELAYGARTDQGTVNPETLQKCLAAVMEAAAALAVQVPADKAAALAAALYQEAIDGRPPVEATVRRMLRAML